MLKVSEWQKAICNQFGSPYLPCELGETIALAPHPDGVVFPINGQRISQQGFSGWFIWFGEEPPEADDAFSKICLFHTENLSRVIAGYLGLDFGWRFLLAPNYVDVWQDAE